MKKLKAVFSGTFMIALMVAALSCQTNDGLTKSTSRSGNGDRKRQHLTDENIQTRQWPGSYPEPVGLKGLGSVNVEVTAVGPIPSDRIAPGPFQEAIQKKAVQMLRSAGILVTGKKGSESALSLHMYLTCGIDSSVCGHLTTLELRRWVRLERSPDVAIAAITWRNSYANGTDRKDILCCLPDQFEADAGTLILDFIDDYRTANPK